VGRRIVRRRPALLVLGAFLLLLAGCGAAEFRAALERLVEYSGWQDQQILFVRGSTSDKTINEIYVMDVNGNNPRKLTQNSVEDKDPCWSPDRSLIVYATLNTTDFELAVMTPAGAFVGYLTEDGGDSHDFQPAWSPGGDRVAYTHWQNPNQVYVKDANLGATESRITDLIANEAFPDWSPDGSEIVFMSQRDGGDWDIMVLEVAVPANIRQLTANGSDDRNPSWSPDGQRITYHSNEDGDYEIYTVNADGTGGKLNLTANTVYSDQSPDWSPDGKKIVFQSNRDGNWEIYSMNPDGSEQTRLTYNEADDISPCW